MIHLPHRRRIPSLSPAAARALLLSAVLTFAVDGRFALEVLAGLTLVWCVYEVVVRHRLRRELAEFRRLWMHHSDAP